MPRVRELRGRGTSFNPTAGLAATGRTVAREHGLVSTGRTVAQWHGLVTTG